jgi:hypothetical protein
MFMQVITGKTNDPAGFQKRFDDWRDRMMPDSIGFLGSTGGVADDGTAIVIARFESEEAASGGL